MLDAHGTRNDPKVRFGDTVTLLPKNDWDLRLRVTQPIYAGLREWKAYRQARLAVRSSHDGLRAAEEGLLRRLIGNYLDVVRGDSLMAVEELSVDLATRRLRQAENCAS